MPAPGAVWGWGANNDGQIGDGTVVDKNLPALSGITGGATAISASSGGWVSMALKTDGTAWAWGNQTLQNPVTSPTQLNLSGITAIAAGRTQSYALKGDGTVYDRDGNQLAGLTSITAIAVGDGSALALKNDGTVWNVGDATQIAGLSAITAIALGAEHSLALKSDGTVYAWGLNEFGQSGADVALFPTVTAPQQVPNLSGVIAIAAGSRQSMALKSDGTVWMWGQGTSGQLGNGSNNPVNSTVVQSQISGVIAISSGRLHSLALKSDGTLWAWGDNGLGQLGNGSFTNTNTPTQVTLPASAIAKVVKIAAARMHTLVLYGPK